MGTNGFIRVRVRPRNSYGSSSNHETRLYKAGEVLEVPAAELLRVPHCLISIEMEKSEQEKKEMSARGSVDPKFEAMKAALAEQRKASLQAQAIHAENVSKAVETEKKSIADKRK